MADINIKLQVAFDALQLSIHKLPDSDKYYGLTELELAGVAAIISSFYNGIQAFF
jgi:hypothetical protein